MNISRFVALAAVVAAPVLTFWLGQESNSLAAPQQLLQLAGFNQPDVPPNVLPDSPSDRPNEPAQDPAAEPAPAAAPFQLDRFKYYDVVDHLVDHKVTIRGVFDKRPIEVRLDKLTCFSTPVNRSYQGIVDPNAHFAWYHFEQPVAEPVHQITIWNEFGKQELALGRPVSLLVPSEKVEPGSAFPQLDHYKAYLVLTSCGACNCVSLQDQFGVQDCAEVGKAQFFCVPVRKQFGDDVSEITNRDVFLTFYSIPQQTRPVSVTTKDQFGTHALEIRGSKLLGVPTKLMTRGSPELPGNRGKNPEVFNLFDLDKLQENLPAPNDSKPADGDAPDATETSVRGPI